MKPSIVDVRNLSVIFGDFYAVRDVSFRVAPGEIFGFLGANGAGKTTTIRVLCGLLPGSRGDVIIDGERFVAGRENIIKQKVGYMSQRFTLYDGLSVKENFDFAAALRGLRREEYLSSRERLLKFIGFKEKLNTVVKDLPGGIKQEVALCVSLLHDPKIVFLDEPTAGVAPVSRNRFWRLIKDLAASGKTVFVTTHYMASLNFTCQWRPYGSHISILESISILIRCPRGVKLYKESPNVFFFKFAGESTAISSPARISAIRLQFSASSI